MMKTQAFFFAMLAILVTSQPSASAQNRPSAKFQALIDRIEGVAEREFVGIDAAINIYDDGWGPNAFTTPGSVIYLGKNLLQGFFLMRKKVSRLLSVLLFTNTDICFTGPKKRLLMEKEKNSSATSCPGGSSASTSIRREFGYPAFSSIVAIIIGGIATTMGPHRNVCRQPW